LHTEGGKWGEGICACVEGGGEARKVASYDLGDARDADRLGVMRAFWGGGVYLYVLCYRVVGGIEAHEGAGYELGTARDAYRWSALVRGRRARGGGVC
jgi:hypothetical protein